MTYVAGSKIVFAGLGLLFARYRNVSCARVGVRGVLFRPLLGVVDVLITHVVDWSCSAVLFLHAESLSIRVQFLWSFSSIFVDFPLRRGSDVVERSELEVHNKLYQRTPIFPHPLRFGYSVNQQKK
jgi:hypothetical protein